MSSKPKNKKPTESKKRRSHPYNNGIKRLMAINQQDMLDWLLPGTIFVRQVSEDFESLTLEADNVFEVISNGQPALLHVEFQTGYDKHMERRLLEYFSLAYRRYNCPIASIVV